MTKACAVATKPSAFFLNDTNLYTEIENGSNAGDPFVEEDVKFCDLKGGCHFIFYNFYFDAVSDFGAVGGFDSTDAADIEADGGVEFEGFTTGGRFGIAEYDADFFSDLVDENRAGVAFC